MGEYNLKESEELVGQLYPILEDKDGNIIDGKHRLKANPDWRRERLETVDSKTKLTKARMASNWDRRKVSKKEKGEWLDGLCEDNPRWRARSGSFVSSLVENTELSERTIQKYLSDKYKQEQKGRPPGDLFPNIIEGDFREIAKQFEDDSFNHIITDPPYGAEYIDLWSALAELASRVLKPGGFCITYSGVYHLPEVINALNKHLDFYWQVIIKHTGATQIVNARNIDTKYKPVFIFAKPPIKKLEKTTNDWYEGTGREKTLHKWAQAEGELIEIIKRFTAEGDSILDPMAGSGTTLVACHKTRRQCTLIESKHENIVTINERMEGLNGK